MTVCFDCGYHFCSNLSKQTSSAFAYPAVRERSSSVSFLGPAPAKPQPQLWEQGVRVTLFKTGVISQHSFDTLFACTYFAKQGMPNKRAMPTMQTAPDNQSHAEVRLTLHSQHLG